MARLMSFREWQKRGNRKQALTVAYTPDGQPFYPTPCCGSFAKGSIDNLMEGGSGVICRVCYQEVDEIYGMVPTEARKTATYCSCAHNLDGTVTTLMCPLHADEDPCYTKALVTGTRRKGSIINGVCTNCGWTESKTATRKQAFQSGDRVIGPNGHSGTLIDGAPGEWASVRWDDGSEGLIEYHSLKAARKQAKVCSECGDAVAQTNGDWHHDSGTKHDHKAQPKSASAFFDNLVMSGPIEDELDGKWEDHGGEWLLKTPRGDAWVWDSGEFMIYIGPSHHGGVEDDRFHAMYRVESYLRGVGISYPKVGRKESHDGDGNILHYRTEADAQATADRLNGVIASKTAWREGDWDITISSGIEVYERLNLPDGFDWAFVTYEPGRGVADWEVMRSGGSFDTDYSTGSVRGGAAEGKEYLDGLLSKTSAKEAWKGTIEVKCPSCGHLHYDPRDDTYSACPADGCECIVETRNLASKNRGPQTSKQAGITWDEHVSDGGYKTEHWEGKDDSGQRVLFVYRSVAPTENDLDDYLWGMGIGDYSSDSVSEGHHVTVIS